MTAIMLAFRALRPFRSKQLTQGIVMIFLCHSSKDKALVREVARHLPKHLSVWLDERELRIGQDLKETLAKAIGSSPFVIAFISEFSMTSSWVEIELREALQLEQSSGGSRILPVLIGSSDSVIPDFLSGRCQVRIPAPPERAIEAAAADLVEAIIHWLINSDSIAGAPDAVLDQLAAEAAVQSEKGRDAGVLARFALPRIQRSFRALFSASVLGEYSSDDLPPAWLRECSELVAIHLQFGVPEAITWGDSLRQPVEQAFLIGYYCCAQRHARTEFLAHSEPNGAELSSIGKVILSEVAAGDVPTGWIAAYDAAKPIVALLNNSIAGGPAICEVLLKAAWQGTIYAIAEERHAARQSSP